MSWSNDASHVMLDPEVVRELCAQQGWDKAAVQAKTGLDARTVGKFYKGERVRMDSANALARALGLADLTSLLPKSASTQPELDEPAEWERVGLPTAWITAANGLQWRISKRRHRFQSSRFARGKSYELSNLSDKERSELSHWFLRHPEVCTSLQRHERFPLCFGTFPLGDAWWVIDEWIEGSTLADILANGGLAEVNVKPVMRQIAEGLQALHERQIIRRELTPRHVVLRDTDHSVVLNDFELGKLLDGSPTVSKEWPTDPYRAPEVAGEGVDARADVYSWARIFVHAVGGQLPEQGQESELVAKLPIPKKLRVVLSSALSRQRSNRPNEIRVVLDALSHWTD